AARALACFGRRNLPDLATRGPIAAAAACQADGHGSGVGRLSEVSRRDANLAKEHSVSRKDAAVPALDHLSSVTDPAAVSTDFSVSVGSTTIRVGAVTVSAARLMAPWVKTPIDSTTPGLASLRVCP